MKKPVMPILIVGAGPTGLTLALELERRGVPFRIVEEREARSPHSKAVSISASTVSIFERMGVVDEMLAVGRKVHDIYVHHEGRRRAHVDYRHVGGKYNFILSLAQPEVERVLEARLAAKVEYGVSLRELTQYPTGVAARLNGETAHFSYVVGCDGARSLVRKALDIPLEGAGYDLSFIHGEFRIDWDGDKDSVHYFMRDGGFWLMVPMPDDWYRIVVGVPGRNPEAHYPALSTEIFERKTGIKLHASRCLSYAKLYHLVGKRVRDGRVFLAGDAFHQFSPIGGQGMNTGVQDAYNLAWKLAYVLKGRVRPEILDSYEHERLPIARQVLAASDASTQLLLGRDHPLREKLLPRMENRHAYRHELPLKFSGLAQSYPESIFVRNLSREKQAGTRAPAHDVRWEGHTLLVRGNAQIDVSEYGEWLRVERERGDGEWFLIRPDGFVEAHGLAEDLAALPAFIDRLYEARPAPYAAFFDVDETLISFSSMPEFIEHVRKSFPGRAKHFRAWDNRGRTTRAEANRLYYAAFTGLARRDVEAIANEWIAEKLRQLGRGFFIRESLTALRRHRAKGARVVLVSGSFSPLLAPIARLLGVTEWLAAPLGERDGVYTGLLTGEPTIGEGKAVAMRAYFARNEGLRPRACFAYGDHASDLPMLASVGHPVVVGDDPTLHAQFTPEYLVASA